MALPNTRRMLIQSVSEVDASLQRALLDAARDAERIIRRTPTGIGGRVSQTQLLAVISELRALSHTLWGDQVPQEIARMIAMAEQRSREGADLMDQVMGARTKNPGIRDAIRASQKQRAKRVIQVFKTREESAKFELSPRVYKWEFWHNGYVERKLASAFARGISAREIAREIREFIDPNTRGGASYAAKRVARTEVANAFHNQTIRDYQDNPFVSGLEWVLSKSHPRLDGCDKLAKGHSRGLPIGVYKTSETPDKPHPQCMCHTSPFIVDDDEFDNGFFGGQYNDYLLGKFPDIDPQDLPDFRLAQRKRRRG